MSALLNWFMEIIYGLLGKSNINCIYNNSQMSNLVFLMDWAQMSDLDFGLIHQNFFHQKGFIPLSKVPFFLKKWQVVIKFLYL